MTEPVERCAERHRESQHEETYCDDDDESAEAHHLKTQANSEHAERSRGCGYGGQGAEYPPSHSFGCTLSGDRRH